jgi:Domain of unknown function (DUF4272)
MDRMLDLPAIRARNTELLAARGFRFAEWLPLRGADDVDLRPRDEIVRRLAALNAVFVYACGSEEHFPERTLREMLRAHVPEAALAEAEREILGLERQEAGATYGDTLGWYSENMLPLAWALGYPQVPAIDGAMLDAAAIKALCISFAPTNSAACAALLEAGALRPAAEIVALEDLFYCCHNAVRSAQHDDPSCVPPAFDPFANGGVIHERRHALTWMLSPGVAWDETDLGT